jgi:hypothetical protein
VACARGARTSGITGLANSLSLRQLFCFSSSGIVFSFEVDGSVPFFVVLPVGIDADAEIAVLNCPTSLLTM